MNFRMIDNMPSLTQTAFIACSHAICRIVENDSVPRFVYSNGAPFPEPAPANACIRASKNAALVNAAFYGIFRSIRAGRSMSRKNLIGLTLAPFAASSEAAFLSRSRQRWHCALRFFFPISVARYVCWSFHRRHFLASRRQASQQ
jgi:hypothetical protein